MKGSRVGCSHGFFLFSVATLLIFSHRVLQSPVPKVALDTSATRPRDESTAKKALPTTTQTAKQTAARKQAPALQFATDPPNKTSRSGDLSCFLYDRPPRTGSTTIGRALRLCVVRRLGFAQLGFADLQDSNKLVHNIMNVATGPLRALVSKHLRFSRADLAVVRARCRRLLYVTSCRPMKERVWSRHKYTFNRGNTNSTLTREAHERAARKVVGDTRNEPFLEGHPYLDSDEKWIDIAEEEKLAPDYVVRNDKEGHFTEDLRKLLSALGCGADFEPGNIHENKYESEEVFDLIKLDLGDTIYRKLKRHGDKFNKSGLERVRDFIKDVFPDGVPQLPGRETEE